jgi:branched-chain amino acid transport system permease protein
VPNQSDAKNASSTSLFPSFRSDPVKAYFATAVVAIVLLLLPILAGQALGNSWIRIINFALLYIMLALGLNIVVGYAGLLDLGYIAFYAVGAYLYALLASPHLAENFEWIKNTFPNGIHTPILVVILCSAGLAAFFGILLGAPTLRLRGDYLAIVTLGFGEIIRIFMQNLNQPINITNGPQGIGTIDPISIFGFEFSRKINLFGIELRDLHWYYYLFLALTIVIIVLSIRLQDSRLGRAWIAIREDEIAAKAMGINTRNVKLLAFGMGASFGGVSGAMFAAFQGFVSPESFTLNESIVVVAMVVLGGIGHVPGVVLGAILLYAVPEALRHYAKPAQEALLGYELIPAEALRMLLFGLAMVVIMLYRQSGLWPSPKHGEKESAAENDVDTQIKPAKTA